MRTWQSNSWKVFDRLQQAWRDTGGREVPDLAADADSADLQQHGAVGPGRLLPALTEHLIGEVEKIAAALPNDRIAMQWDVCQEVLAWEGYYEKGPVDVRTETIDVLTADRRCGADGDRPRLSPLLRQSGR